MAWEELPLGAEFDGLEAHMTPRQLAADRGRHNWLTERRWLLRHVTGVDVHRRHDAMVGTVRRQMRRQRVVVWRGDHSPVGSGGRGAMIAG